MTVLDSYSVEADGVSVTVDVVREPGAFVLKYAVEFPEFGAGTKALLDSLKRSVVSEVSISVERMMDPSFIRDLKEKFSKKASSLLQKQAPNLDGQTRGVLVGMLLQEMLGLGKIEFLLRDSNLEEIAVNSGKSPVWVYHKKFGWLKTDIFLGSDADVQNYANIIARRIGKQITVLNPLLDAHLITGDRANATLFPISSTGNTITIRRFRRAPWTVTDFIKNKTASSEVMALMWLAMQFELNIVISGGTGAGKTSMLNVCSPFIQSNHRVISIEGTRELQMPGFLHWIPLTTRDPNPEGKGEVSMLDLLVNSLRMRPDRIIVGEIRRQREAEVMFEAMHTGHSVYTTVHANTAEETVRRLTGPPISIPSAMLDSVHLNMVMFRNRRDGTRRVLQLAEYVSEKRSGSESVRANVLYRWKASTDAIQKSGDSLRLFDELSLHTGLSPDELHRNVREKQGVLEWMARHGVTGVQRVGTVIAEYYLDESKVLGFVEKDRKPEWIGGDVGEKESGETGMQGVGAAWRKGYGEKNPFERGKK